VDEDEVFRVDSILTRGEQRFMKLMKYTKKRGKLRCVLLRRRKIFFLFVKSLHGIFFEKRPITTVLNFQEKDFFL